MASITAAAVCAAPSVALSASSSASTTSSARAQLGAPVLRTRSAAVAKPATWSSKTVSNGSRVNAFNVLNPNTNAKFETLSYLPPLTDEQILAQINYLLKNKWIPAIEFDTYGLVHRTHSQLPTYYDGRYWVMWKLPLFGANAPEQVLNEVQNCKKEYPDAYVRVIAFDNVRQVQVVSFLVAKPPQKS